MLRNEVESNGQSDNLWKDHIDEALEALRSPPWLKSPHGGIELNCILSKDVELKINFDITLPDGSSLADARYQSLRAECFDFFCILDRPPDGGRARSAKSVRAHMVRGVHILDHMFFVHGAKLSKHGFKSITGQDLIEIVRLIASSKAVVDNLYDWHGRLTNYLKDIASNITPEILADTLERQPRLAELPQEREILELTSTELLKARVALYRRGFYKSKEFGEVRVNSSELSEAIFQNTLAVKSLRLFKKKIGDLAIGIGESYREFEGAPTRTGYDDERCSKHLLAEYKSTIHSWRHLCAFGNGIPLNALLEAERYDPSHSINLKPLGHTNPLPSEAVTYALDKAVTFFYDHGDHILKSLSNLLIAAHENNLPVLQFSKVNDITPLLTMECLDLGINKWSIVEFNESKAGFHRPDNYHQLLRSSNSGLFEMAKVLNGAANICTGLMSAARNGELLDLTALSTDETNSWIELSSRKSGFGSIRKSQWRPIPVVTGHILSAYQAFHNSLAKAGIQPPKSLLSTVSFSGAMGITANSFNYCNDLFCDYIEMPLDHLGRRFYIRQHQLRQYFIVAFFYASGISGIETLRWFVRHFDPQHLWAYLRQNVAGSTMMRHKSVALKSMIRNNSEQVADLISFLTLELGANRFDVLSDNELIEYLTELQELGTVEIEPLFYQDSEGTRWRLGITIFGEKN